MNISLCIWSASVSRPTIDLIVVYSDNPASPKSIIELQHRRDVFEREVRQNFEYALIYG